MPLEGINFLSTHNRQQALALNDNDYPLSWVQSTPLGDLERRAYPPSLRFASPESASESDDRISRDGCVG